MRQNGKDILVLRAQKRFFCVELSATAINQVIPDFAEKPWGIDPMELKVLADAKLEYLKTIQIRK